MKELIILILIFMTSLVSSCQSKRYEPNFDFDLYLGTKAYYLAKAVETEDTQSVSSFVIKDGIPVDFQELKFRNTLLTLAIVNAKIKATQKLLDLGANPNKPAANGTTPFVQACLNSKFLPDIKETLKTLIKHRAEVNTVIHDTTFDQFGKRKNSTSSVLQFACIYGTLDCVKLLVENGADLVYNFTKDSIRNGSIVTTAVLSGNLEVLRYFLIEKKLHTPAYCIIRQSGNVYEKKLTVTDLLNENNFRGYPKKRRLKYEILNFLKANHEK